MEWAELGVPAAACLPHPARSTAVEAATTFAIARPTCGRWRRRGRSRAENGEESTREGACLIGREVISGRVWPGRMGMAFDPFRPSKILAARGRPRLSCVVPMLQAQAISRRKRWWQAPKSKNWQPGEDRLYDARPFEFRGRPAKRERLSSAVFHRVRATSYSEPKYAQASPSTPQSERSHTARILHMNTLGQRASGIGVLLLLLSPAGLLPSCGGGTNSGGGSGGGGDMFIETCSLGCGNGAGGAQVSCTIVDIAVDREIDVFFSDAIDPASVNSTTFQLIDATTGQAPVGTRFVDSSDPTKMIFRPAITFDSQGNVSFGFNPLTTYLITIAGTAHHDTGPFVRSVSGKNNQSRMSCQVHTTSQVDDLVAGPPLASVWVSLATGQPPPNDHLDHQPAAGAVNVWHNSTISFTFNDVMNPVSLVNPNTHQATLITIQVDSDGDPATTNDEVTLFGTYALTIDLQHLTTELLFTPANGIPSAGEQSLPPPLGSNSPRF